MSDAAHSRDQLFRAYTSKPIINDRMKIFGISLAISIVASSLVQMSPHFVSMKAEDYYRLNDAIQALAISRRCNPQDIWKKIYFQLHTSSVSDLKQSQVDEIGRMILDEMTNDLKG